MIGGRTPDPIIASRVVRVGPCSRVIVSSDFVLTSAHCLAFSPSDIRVSTTLREEGDGVVGLLDCAPHPAYVEGNAAHDLALCRLARSMPLSPLALEESAILPGRVVTMAGYGRDERSEPSTHDLRQVDTIVTAAREGVLVVGTPDHTACHGDSGGPVFTNSGMSLHLVAVVRGTTEAMCKTGAETVELASHRAWYEQTVHQASRSEAATFPLGLVLALFVLGVLVFVVASRWRYRVGLLAGQCDAARRRGRIRAHRKEGVQDPRK